MVLIAIECNGRAGALIAIAAMQMNYCVGKHHRQQQYVLLICALLQATETSGALRDNGGRESSRRARWHRLTRALYYSPVVEKNLNDSAVMHEHGVTSHEFGEGTTRHLPFLVALIPLHPCHTSLESSRKGYEEQHAYFALCNLCLECI